MRLGIGKWPQQHAVQYAEDRRIRSDADGQRQQYGDCEARRPPQPAAHMLQIDQHRFESLPLPHFTAPLPEECHIAEIATRSSFGLLARHAFFHQFIGPLVDVFLDGDGDIVIAAISGEEATEP